MPTTVALIAAVAGILFGGESRLQGFAAVGAEGFDAIVLQHYTQLKAVEHLHTGGNSSGIVDGAWKVFHGKEKPLFHFGPQRFDIACARIEHYTGIPVDTVQRYILFTNYAMHTREFVAFGLRAMEILRDQPAERLHSRKLRSFAETAFQ